MWCCGRFLFVTAIAVYFNLIARAGARAMAKIKIKSQASTGKKINKCLET